MLEVWSINKTGSDIETRLMAKSDDADIYKRVGTPVSVAEDDGDYILIIDDYDTITLRKLRNSKRKE